MRAVLDEAGFVQIEAGDALREARGVDRIGPAGIQIVRTMLSSASR